MCENVTSGVHFPVKILQPPQTRVYFGLFVNDDSYEIIPYILINLIKVNRSKNTLHVGGNFVLIERNKVKHQCNKLKWFYRQSVVLILSLQVSLYKAYRLIGIKAYVYKAVTHYVSFTTYLGKQRVLILQTISRTNQVYRIAVPSCFT